MQSPAAKYRKEVNKRIACPRVLKKAFLQQLEMEALYFCSEHEDADVNMLYAQFGSPEEVADEFLSELNERTVEYYNSKSKRILRFTMAVLFAAAAVLTVLGVRKYNLQKKLTAEEFIASITYEKESDSDHFWFLPKDTIFSSNGIENVPSHTEH